MVHFWITSTAKIFNSLRLLFLTLEETADGGLNPSLDIFSL